MICITNQMFQVIKSRRMRWVGHVERLGGEERLIQDFGGETRRKETTWKAKV